MASNQSTFTLNLQTRGMQQAQDQSQAIANNLQAAAAASRQLGTAGSRRVAASAAAPTGAMASAGAPSGTQVRDYNVSRGAAGAAGGTARDFADQARGLGGLVRLYATYAANLFAVTAAFNALSAAMDTSNMVKGLDQIGASSGRALGTLSKELVKATDGALSLREAMEATTKATSAGLSSTQVVELGKAATKASQALGLNLTDAVSRLSRGISKLEPELLDELGIYVKIDDAVEKYARTLGKTASSLTSYERTQAFATEALAQANKKFGEIELDTNPYSKLSASLKDLAQSAGEFINGFLAPVVKYLSQSPMALALAVGFIAKTVIKQAVPAFGEYRAGLQKALEDTKNKASALVRAQKELAEARDEAASAGAQTRFRQDPGIQARLQDLKQQASLLSRTSRTDYASIADIDPIGMSSADLAAWEKKLERRAKALDRNNDIEADLIRAHIQDVKNLNQEADAAATAAQQAVEQRDTKFYSQMTVTRMTASRALKQANRADILNEVDKVQKLEGVRAAWKKLNEELAAPSRKIKLIDPETGEEIEETIERTKGLFGYIERGTTRLRGGLGIAVQGVLDFATAWGPLISTVITSAIAAFEVLDGWFSTNKKQLEEFKGALEAGDNAAKLVSDTLTRISKQELGSALLPQNIEARANAFVELSNSIEKTANSFNEVNKASSWWDNLVDSIKGLASQGRLDDLGKSLSKQINSALEAINLEDRDTLTNKLKSILDVTDLDTTEVVRSLNKAGKEGGAALAEQISKSVKEASAKAASEAAKLKEALSVFDNLNKSYQDLANSLRDTSSLSNFAKELIQGSIDAQQALSNTTNTVSYFRELVKDPKKLRLFDENSIKLAKNFENQLETTAKSIQSIETEVRAAEKAFEKTFGESYVNEIGVLVTPTIDEAEQNKLREKIQAGLKAKAELDLNAENIKGKLAGILEQPLIKGMQIATQEFQKSMQKVQLDVISSLVSRLSGTGRAEAEFQIQKERIEIEKSSISAMYELVRAVEKNSVTIKQVDTEKALRERGEKLGTAGGLQIKDTEYIRLETNLKELTAGAEILDKGLNVTADDFEKLRKTFPGIAKELISFFQTSMGTRSKLAQQEGQKKVAEIARDFGRSEEGFKTAQDKRKSDLELLNIAKDRQSLLSNIYGIENTSLVVSKQIAAAKAEEKSQEIARAEIAEKISQAEFAQKKLGEEKVKQGAKFTPAMQAALTLAENSVKEEKDRLKLFNEQTEARNKLTEVQNNLEKISSQTAAEQKKLEFDKQRTDTASELAQISMNSAKQEFDSLVARGLLSEEYAANRTAQFATEAQQLQYNRQISDAIAQKRLQDLQTEDQFKKALAAGDTELAATIARDQQLAKSNELFAGRIRIINDNNTLAQRGIEIEKNKALETAKTNKLLEDQKDRADAIASIGDSLAAAFGKAGTAISGFLTTFDTIIANQETYNSSLEKQYDIMSSSRSIMNDPGKSEKERADAANAYNKAQIETGKLTKKNAQDELTNSAKLVGATKGLFNEKSRGYQAFAKIEKALHIARLAMEFKEQFVKLTTDKVETVSKLEAEAAQTAGTQAGAAARAPTYIGEIYGKTIGQLGPIAGPVVAAGLVALVLSYLGGSAGGAPPGGFTAEEQQKVQGTSQYYDSSGKLQTRAGGVLGDPTAKSDVVAKGIQAIEKYSFETLESSNEMLDALKAIEKNTKSFTSSLLKAVPNLNLTPETIKSGNWLFGKETTETLDRGFKIVGNVGQIIDKQAKLLEYTKTKTTSSGFLGIFGGGTSYGGGDQAINDPSGRLAKDLSKTFTSVIAAVGSAAKTIFTDVTPEAVSDAFRSLDLSEQLKVSLMGLKGTEAAEAVLSVINSGIDSAVTILFPTLEKFQEVGESMGDVIIRLANDMRVVTNSLELMGFNLPVLTETYNTVTQDMLDRVNTAQDILEIIGTEDTEALAAALRELKDAQDAIIVATKTSTTKNLDLQQTLIEGAGGLEEFTKKTNLFAENFLTAEERLIPIRQKVQSTFREFSGVISKAGFDLTNFTREGFKNLVLSLQDTNNAVNITTTEGQALFKALMNIQGAFLSVTQATKDVDAERVSLQEKFVNLTSTSTEKRQRELEAIDKSNQSIQEAIYQWEDFNEALTEAQKKLADAESKLTQAQSKIDSILNTATQNVENARKQYEQAILERQNLELSTYKETIDKLKGYSKSLTEYVNSLTGKNTTTGTTAELTKSFMDLVSRARTGDTEALDKLTQAGDSLLESAKASARSSSDIDRIKGIIRSQVTSVIAATDQSILSQERLVKEALIRNNPALTAEQITKAIADLDKTPLEKAQDAIDNAKTALDSAIKVAETIGAPLQKLPEDLITAFNKAFAEKALVELDITAAKAEIAAIKEKLEDIKTNTGSTAENTKQIIVKIVTDIGAEVKKAIAFIVDDTRLPPELKLLALQTVGGLDKTVNFILGKDDLTDDQKKLALETAVLPLSKTINLILGKDDLTDDQKKVAIQTVDRLDKVVNFAIGSDKLTTDDRDIVLNRIADLNKNIDLIIKDTGIDPTLKTLALLTGDTVSRTLELTVNAKGNATAEELKTIGDTIDLISSNVSLALDPNSPILLDPQQKEIFFGTTNSFQRAVNLVLESPEKSGLTAEQRNVLFTSGYIIQKAISISLSDDPALGLTEKQRNTYFDSATTLSKTIGLVLSDDPALGLTKEQKSTYFDTTQIISKALSFAIDPKSPLNPEQKGNLLDATTALGKSLELAVSKDSTLTPAQITSLLDATATLNRTVNASMLATADPQAIATILSTSGNIEKIVNTKLDTAADPKATGALTSGGGTVNVTANTSLSSTADSKATGALNNAGGNVDLTVNTSSGTSTLTGTQSNLVSAGQSTVELKINFGQSGTVTITGDNLKIFNLQGTDYDSKVTLTLSQSGTITTNATVDNIATQGSATTSYSRNITLTLTQTGTGITNIAVGSTAAAIDSQTTDVSKGRTLTLTLTQAGTGITNIAVGSTAAAVDAQNTDVSKGRTLTLTLSSTGTIADIAANSITATINTQTADVSKGRTLTLTLSSTGTIADIAANSTTATINAQTADVSKGRTLTLTLSSTGTIANIAANSTTATIDAQTADVSKKRTLTLDIVDDNDTITLTADETVISNQNGDVTRKRTITLDVSRTGTALSNVDTALVTAAQDSTTKEIKIGGSASWTLDTAIVNIFKTIAAGSFLNIEWSKTIQNEIKGLRSDTRAISTAQNLRPTFEALGSYAGYSSGTLIGSSSAYITEQASALFPASDIRLKQNIELARTLSNGINLYDFEYNNLKYGVGKKRGVLAQEIMGNYPDAVFMADDGFLRVDYSQLPIPSNMLKFAQGGVFNNSIVDSPTAFSMGLMGEDGPEAIMPLQRGPDGSLGVVGYGTNSQQDQLLKVLIEEVKNLRSEVRSDVAQNAKVARILTRVTPDGDALAIGGSVDGGKL